ncbi:MAG: endonuclease/exonuclease/phosphatase family protein [Colwellia sp.]|nr:endonuclease/exonuclease/phosphatase family protein [Colwellia sp.]
MKNVSLLFSTFVLLSGVVMAKETIPAHPQLRVATFNVSMEALNYLPYVRGKAPNVKGNELSLALNENNQQIKNIAEIIQRINPDIILLNEFDREDDSQQSLKLFLSQYLSKGQGKQQGIDFPYFYQGAVNTGVPTKFDLNNDGSSGKSPSDNYGFGYFPGHFGMALLSKYPIDMKKIRTFQKFKWNDMPNALKPFDPETKKPWFSDEAWRDMRLSSKSHWDIPVNVNGKTIHILASHPTPPVFDGPEDRNGKRNHDEIRFWHDYISNTASYIYDDNGNKDGLNNDQAFIILGDQNASSVDGDAMVSGITSLLTHEKVQDAKPESLAGKMHKIDNPNAKNHTAHWGMRADYVLPSRQHFKITNSAVFWPQTTEETYRLVKDRAASSDHRLVWVDLELK